MLDTREAEARDPTVQWLDVGHRGLRAAGVGGERGPIEQLLEVEFTHRGPSCPRPRWGQPRAARGWSRLQTCQPAGRLATQRPTSRERRCPILLTAGILLVALGVIFRVVIVPSLLKIPTNLNKTAHFAGQQLVYVNPKSGAPLPAPQRLPLTITRHITGVPNASDGNRVVLAESVTAEVKGLPPLSQHNRYVMDRKSAGNVADSRSFASAPVNKADRSVAYRLAV